jgi:hypothetical protein
MARLVAGGVTLRDQVNRKWVSRDKRSDGWLGDRAHQARVSDHNPDRNGWVHAIDIDHDLLGANGGKAGTDQAEEFANQLIKLAREGKDGGRLKYVVYKNRIASGTHKNQFWTWRTGNWGHPQHIHVSFNPSAQRDGRPFNLPIFGISKPEPSPEPKPTEQHWDGSIPNIQNVKSAESDPNLKNLASWRVASRLKDLGFYRGNVLPKYQQGYPVRAVQAFQVSRNIQTSLGYDEKTHKALFG